VSKDFLEGVETSGKICNCGLPEKIYSKVYYCVGSDNLQHVYSMESNPKTVCGKDIKSYSQDHKELHMCVECDYIMDHFVGYKT
jgi:hypothetical protein